MAFCRTCGNEVNEKAIACPECGVNPIDGTKHCQGCGEETNEKAVVCTKCGVSLGNVNTKNSIPSTNPNPMDQTQAIIWFVVGYFFCYLLPVGYIKMKQPAKGWVMFIGFWVLLITGLSVFIAIVWAIDYWMCYIVQKDRELEEWEFFPTKK